MFKVFVETTFAAAHQLHKYKGACGKLHGHTWKVRVEVTTDRADDMGISFDFKSLKAITEAIIERLDHRHINEVPPFDRENPTAENLSRYIYEETRKELPTHVHVSQVTVWESEKYAVSYSED